MNFPVNSLTLYYGFEKELMLLNEMFYILRNLCMNVKCKKNNQSEKSKQS